MNMHNRPTLVAALFVLLLGAACQSKTTTKSESTVGTKTSEAPAGNEVAKRNNALVRVVNARDDQVDIYFGDMKAFTEVGAEKVTPYSELPAERHDLKLLPAGKDATTSPLATNSEGLSEGMHYTVVAFKNKDGSSGVNLFKDDLINTTNGKARVRVINVATGVDEVDVYPAGQKDVLAKGVNFNSATGYKEVDPSIKSVEVHKKGDKQVAASIPDLSLSPGKTYTLFVLNDSNALKVIPVEDQLVG
jgi:hypothetical protein